MRIVGTDLTFIDYPSPEVFAFIVYFSGCNNNCINCHNIELQNPDKGDIIINNSEELKDFIEKQCERYKTRYIVFSGGDPLYYNNKTIIIDFLLKYGKLYNICLYTGLPIEMVKAANLKGFTYIKCGKYEEQFKQQSGNFADKFMLASTNQNIFDENYKQLSDEGILYYGNE